MSPLNRGPLLGPRVPPAGIRPPPPPRFGGRLPPPGLPPRMPPPPMSPVFGPMRQRLPPPPRPGGVNRPNGPMPLFGPRVRGMAPMVPPLGLRGAGPRGPLMRPWPRRGLPPQILSHMRPRFSIGNGNAKGKAMNNVKKVNKLEELELKKPWMTDEIRSEIQKKNKLYAKAKKNKDAKEWEEFKDLRNKVTRMIRDAKNDYLAKNPEQGGQKTDDKNTNESEGVQKTENATEQSEQTEQMEEMQPSSEQAHLYPDDEEPYDQRDVNYVSSEDDESFYCEICDRDFPSEDSLSEHNTEHKLCGIDGCTFSAHPLLIQKHITMQHSTGLYNKIKNISTPEDIEKWINERKKKYPTKANIELRKAEEMEKVERGEIIKEQKDVTKRKKKKLSRSQNRKRMIKTNNQTFNDTPQQKKLYRGVPEFPGTLNLRKPKPEDEHQSNSGAIESEHEEIVNHISDEEEIPVTLSESIVSTSFIPSLVANYGSGSEESDAPEEVPIKRMKIDDDVQESESNRDKVIVKSEVVNNAHVDTNVLQCFNQQLSTDSTSTSKSSNRKKKEDIKLNRQLKDKSPNHTVKKIQSYRSELLEKLLSRSIQHERNLICQCIKYIVDNKFFDS